MLPRTLSDFISGLTKSFNGTAFSYTFPDGKVQQFNVSRHNPELFEKIIESYKDATSFDSTIIFGIPFCLAYQVKHKTKDQEKIFGREVSVAFPVPKNVQDYFKFRTVLQLDQKASLHSSKLEDLSSQIAQLKALLASSLDYRQVLVADVDELRRGLSDLQSKFNEADQQVRVLGNLMAANSEAISLFGKKLAVLQPDFSSVLQDCESKLRIYTEQVRALIELISGKEKMLSEQCAAIATIETNLRKKVVEQNETESALRSMQMEIFQELSKFRQDVLPHQLLKYVEELRLQEKMQQAALILAAYVRKVSAKNFVDARNESFKMCSICLCEKTD